MRVVQRGGRGWLCGAGGAGQNHAGGRKRKKSGDKKILKTKIEDSWIRSSGAVRRRDAICWPCLVCLNKLLTCFASLV